MLRALAATTALLAGCWETCPPPAEPQIDFVVIVDVPIADGQYLHAALFNPLGAWIDSRESEVASMWNGTLGHCDGEQQQSGQFKVITWLNMSSVYYEHEPAAGDVQAMDLIDVTCANDACYPARDAHITLR